MNKRLKTLLVLSLSFLATSCDISFDSSSQTQPDSSAESSSDNTSSDTPIYSGSGEVTLYSINDFHGTAKQNQSNGEIGLLDVGTYLKNKGKEANTLLIDSGDMFQGSIESNWTHGKFLDDAMDIIGFDAFTLGNHEFDWGIDNLRSLVSRHEYAYKTPWLCSNVYKWDDSNKTATDERVTDLGSLYSTQVLENGLKVGFIGAIGSDQWTSITSKYVDDLTFVDPIPVIKNVSDTLRTKENCDLVFLTYHGSQSQLLGQGITDVSSVSHKKYVDSVFCAHTHVQETATENGVIFTQNNCNGRNASKIVLTIGDDKTVTNATRTLLNWSDVVNEVNGQYDEELKRCYDTYTADTDLIGSEVLATLNGSFGKYFSNLVADSMLEEALKQGYNPVLAMTNNPRDYPSAGDFTYAGLMKAVPFENAVVIFKAKGSDIKKEAKYSSTYIARNPAFSDSLDNDTMYEIACVDYMAYHMNTRHVYDYFPSAQFEADLLNNGEMYGYRDITADYLRNKKTVSASDYQSSVSKFDKSKL